MRLDVVDEPVERLDHQRGVGHVENVNVVAQGTLTLYHDEHCTMGTDYPAGSAFPTHPDETHLAKNLGSVDLIVFATYFAPKTTPPTPVRVDAPLPGAGCPQ